MLLPVSEVALSEIAYSCVCVLLAGSQSEYADGKIAECWLLCLLVMHVRGCFVGCSRAQFSFSTWHINDICGLAIAAICVQALLSA